MRMTAKAAVLLCFCCFCGGMDAEEGEETNADNEHGKPVRGLAPYNHVRKDPVQPIAQGEDFFILYVNKQVLHVNRKTGETKTLLWAGVHRPPSFGNPAHRRYEIQIMDMKVDKQRLYAVGYGRRGPTLYVIWLRDGALLNEYPLVVRKSPNQEAPEGSLMIGSTEGGPIVVRENSIEVWGAKVFFDGKTISKIAHAPEPAK